MLAAASVAQAQNKPASAKIDRKIKVGIVGCGGRGSWIAGLFHRHGGYEFIAAADYFQDRAEKTGTSLGANKSKCFSGLSAYKRLIESGVEAVILETPPYFFPKHAEAAVRAGLHVYMAKPVAVDVPGTLKIGALGKTSTENKRVFLVDYQMPTDPVNREVCKRLRQGGLGKLQMVFSVGTSGGGSFNDPPLTGTIESRLTNLIWVNDDALGCGYIGNFDIHVVDAVIWALGKRPVLAYGKGGRCRKDPHGDSFDTNFVTYTFDDGLAWNHQTPKVRLTTGSSKARWKVPSRAAKGPPACPIGEKRISAAAQNILGAERSRTSTKPARGGISRRSTKMFSTATTATKLHSVPWIARSLVSWGARPHAAGRWSPWRN